MTGLELIAGLSAFVVVALGGRAFALWLRRRGHGAKLDALHEKTVAIQLTLLRGRASLLRTAHYKRPGAEPPDSPKID